MKKPKDLARQAAKSKEVMQQAANQVASDLDAIHPRDRRRVCAFSNRAWLKARRRQYANAEEFRRDAEATLKPKAIDWSKVQAFIENMMAMIQAIINSKS